MIPYKYPSSIVPLSPEEDKTDFATYQDEFDKSRWQGRGLSYCYPSTHATANDPGSDTK